ncbi:tryptophan synthase subunit alpha [Parendozoicomonas haliclonae]|uniref:Tryptophan synthase alpha chain n=1 Tax=Parendozoicomonas haliclonae TaxID=1960125 RepID=A0A1X7AKM8_9GAMM|nr:tryptophan synthase subunit alpha [Parendozoicomonas haliclonae]SMA47485.1 Tryptophan synthase alpha chain [Parendozoicomonas haliclonae]
MTVQQHSFSTRPDSKRIDACFARLQAEGRKGLIPYVTAGDPHPDVTVPLMHAMVEAGADIIELGIPFSDPVADGPVIELAHQRAVSQGVTLADVLVMVTEFRKKDNVTPVALMGYLNPVEIMGYDEFATRAAVAGVDALLTVDVPPEDADFLVEPMRKAGLEAIFLVSPNTADERITGITRVAGGYIYYVSIKGITGAGGLDTDAVSRRVAHVKSMTPLPVCVGFGIRDGESAAALSKTADAVIVGTALVQELASHEKPADAIAAVAAKVADMRTAMDR